MTLANRLGTARSRQDGGPMNRPLVSILTPSFNQARWLADNLRSVAAQSYPVIEHIVMDGGSTDGSRDILAAAPPGVVWESGSDGGQSDAINKAFDKSTGDIIGWLNSDDAYFSRDAVAKAVEVFEKHPEVGLVYGHSVLVNAADKLLHVLWAPPYSARRLRLYSFINQPTVFIRRSVIDRDFLVDPRLDYQMDRELWLHLAEVTRFQRVDAILAIDRHHLQRKSYTRMDLAQHDELIIRDRYQIPKAGSSRMLHHVIKVGLRFVGLKKAREAARGSDALPVGRSPTILLAFRQVAQLRRWMPSGDEERS
jgi:glycosyltransferase involved in cell wall biosynthesis